MNLRLHQSARVGLGVIASFAIATVATAWIGHERSPSLCTDCDLTAHPPPIIAPPATDTRSQFPVASSYASRVAASAVPVVAELAAPVGTASIGLAPHDTRDTADIGRARDVRFAPARLQGASAAHAGGGVGGAATHIGGSGGGGMGASGARSLATNHVSSHSPAHAASSHNNTAHPSAAHAGGGHSAVAAGVVTPAAVTTVAAAMTATTPAAIVSPVFSQDTVAPSQVAFARSTAGSIAGGGGLASIGGGGSLSATPEPGTLILMLTGTLGIFRWRRSAR